MKTRLLKLHKYDAYRTKITPEILEEYVEKRGIPVFCDIGDTIEYAVAKITLTQGGDFNGEAIINGEYLDLLNTKDISTSDSAEGFYSSKKLVEVHPELF